MFNFLALLSCLCSLLVIGYADTNALEINRVGMYDTLKPQFEILFI